MFCAWCGTQVPVVSYQPCPRCGNPTNGAERRAVAAPQSGVNTALIVVIVGVVALVVLAVAGILAAIAIPNLLTAMNRAKQKRTIADLRTVATALESYATDNNRYPTVQSYDELAPLLTPKYIAALPRQDGWGHPFQYGCGDAHESVCTQYIVASTGKDGVLERELPAAVASPRGPTTNYDCDIIYASGRFVEYPEGAEH